MRKLKLSTPIEGHETIHELTFKMPKARMFRIHGSPNRVSSVFNQEKPFEVRQEIITDEAVYCAFIADMTGIDTITIDDMSAFDYEQSKRIVLEMCQSSMKDDKGNPTT